MIPKTIHYCWFGGQTLSADAQAMIATWRRCCPDYEIIEWNESNFDVAENTYCREAYEAGKWAFVADYARLKVLAEYGGIYMDTDVEVVRPFDSLLSYQAFCCFEKDDSVSIGTLGAAAGSEFVQRMLDDYEGRSFLQPDGSYDQTTNLHLATRVLVEDYQLRLNGRRQVLPGDIAVLPMESLIAKDINTGWLMADASTYAIHHYAGSWVDEAERQRMERRRRYLSACLRSMEPLVGYLASARIYYEDEGYMGVLKKTANKLYESLKTFIRGGI